MLARNIDHVIFWLMLALVFVLMSPVSPYVLPDPTFVVLKPKGLRVSISDASGLQLFGFHANINRTIRANERGEIVGNVYLARNGRWTFEDSEATIDSGDVLHYWIYAQVEGMTYKKNNQMWTYHPATDDEDNNTTIITNERTSAQLLFEDNFESLNESTWTREIKMPLSPDYEFCVYHNANHEQIAKINDGKFYIRPIILEDSYGENATAYGRLRLNGCTSTIAFECTRQALSYNILPPVISARFTTKQSFVFRYGKIEIRAKFPQGDWIYPEMWLEPKYSIYGPNYASGRVLLGLSRGNENLVNATDVTRIYDGRKLDFGVRIGTSPNIEEKLISKINEFGPRWTQDFHVYTTIWTSNEFTFLVDDVEIGTVGRAADRWMPGVNEGSISAPFDEEFYITLGVGVGGVRVFPDGTRNSGLPKPWRNLEVKSMLHFWNGRNLWLPTWRQQRGEKTAFVIDYVRVWAL